MRTIRRLDKIVISAVNGYAIQVGLSLVLASDYAVAARSAQFGSASCAWDGCPTRGVTGCSSSTSA